MNERRSLLPSLALAAAGCFWGTGFYFGKIALEEMSVAENVTLRFLFASLLLLPILIKKWKRPTGRHMVWIVVSAITGVPLQFLLQFAGLSRTTVSHASLLVGTLPVLLALSSAVFLGERLHGIEWLVLLVSALGAVLIAISSAESAGAGGPTLSGDIMVFGSLCLALVMILCTKSLIPLYGSLFLTALMLTIGTVALVVWAESIHALHIHHSAPSSYGLNPFTPCTSTTPPADGPPSSHRPSSQRPAPMLSGIGHWNTPQLLAPASSSTSNLSLEPHSA